MQHHYHGSHWPEPAPTEGEVYEYGGGFSLETASLARLAVFREYLKSIPLPALTPAYGLRTGLNMLGIADSTYDKERTITRTMPTPYPAIMAGIGFVTLKDSSTKAGNVVALSRYVFEDKLDWTVRFYRFKGTPSYNHHKVTLLDLQKAPDEETNNQFLQIFREVTWNSVSEPA